MKKYISIITVVAAVTFTSCSDFLDVQPEGKPTTENYFANDQQAIDAIDMLYGRLHQENVLAVNSSGNKAAVRMLYGDAREAMAR